MSNHLEGFSRGNDKITCLDCHGRGSRQEMGEEDCLYCRGTGRDFNSEFWALPCNHCGGSGRVTYCRTVTCNVCNGSGYLDLW